MLSADSLQKHFHEWGGPGDLTRDFEDLSDEIRESILQSVRLGADESPAVAYHSSSRDWTLLTTKRLMWCVAGAVQELAYSRIRDVNPSICYARFLEGKVRAVPTLEVASKEGRRYLIGLEGGASFVAVWNLIALMATMRWEDVHPQMVQV